MPLSQSTVGTDSIAALSKIKEDVSFLHQNITQGNLEEIFHTLIGWGLNLGKQIFLAIVVYLIGRWVIARLMSLLVKIMEKREFEASLKSFLKSFLKIILNLLLIVVIIGILGIETSSFVALFASAGVAIGLALSGTLQNFAGGVMLLIFKPFKVGDVIEAQDYIGTVKEIQITNTLINTFDNQIVILPNGALSNQSLKNITRESTRRVDWVFTVAYGDSYDLAKEVLFELIEADQRILKEPAPFVGLKALSESSVDIVVRVWVDVDDYWGVFYDMNEKVYKNFPLRGLNFPFPQRDIHFYDKTKDLNP